MEPSVTFLRFLQSLRDSGVMWRFDFKIQGVKKRMDPFAIFACFITLSFIFLEIYNCKQGKPSTNGTWLYLNEDFEMHSGMVFKAN